MSRLFDYYLEKAEDKMEQIILAFKSKKITKEEATKQMLEDENIKICLLQGMPVDAKDAVQDFLNQAQAQEGNC
mgnify:FL=1|jgi:hypothetical protein|tara:strand:+ start:5135 stop:5356 length:222 start_codon:yes stop_codon:yes gene_type:complete